MTKVVIVHVKTVPNWDVSEDGTEAEWGPETSETQAKVDGINWEVWEISWDLTQSQEHSGESRKPLRHFYSPSPCPPTSLASDLKTEPASCCGILAPGSQICLS